MDKINYKLDESGNNNISTVGIMKTFQELMFINNLMLNKINELVEEVNRLKNE